MFQCLLTESEWVVVLTVQAYSYQEADSTSNGGMFGEAECPYDCNTE